MRSSSPSNAEEETDSLRQSISGTTIDWHANNISRPFQSQDAAESESDNSGKTPY